MIDTLVVGAGLSGLVCARRLVEAGRSVVVVDARDRVGGRLHTGSIAGRPIDLGGQWMSIGQPRLAALASELGIAITPQLRDGNPLFGLPPAGLLSRVATAFSQWRLAREIQRLSRDPIIDDRSLAAWLDEHARNPTARAVIAMHAELVFAADPADLSLLHYLRTFAATGGFGSRGTEHRFVGGAQQLASTLADRMDIQLSTPVRAITDGVVTTDHGTIEANHIVLAIPPYFAAQLLGTIGHRPGPVVKCFAAYDRAFWRDDGWSGEAYRPTGDVRATVALDDILLAFVVGPAAASWSTRDPAERRQVVIDAFVEQFGEAAEAPLDYVEINWAADPWSAGCVAGCPPGALAMQREPIGRVHFAGTESADAWPGYMEGAIEAGERAAREVLAR